MACEYFVNGNWVTEDQLKEILNNGLLDNLVSSEQIKLAGFTPDPAKLLKTTTKTYTSRTVPAAKLAEILINEVKTRQGYSMNILASLELNAAGTDFKIPLWASPYAQKFESLLTSIVSKKVIKTKTPGNSYVLGSQEGFKIKQGDKAAGALKDSGIVFSSNFDPEKGLLPARYDAATKTMLPDQIMVPFKFRDEAGKILNLKEFVIKGEDGRMMMDTDKIPEKLLKLFGYRIPTGGRNQMASVEIVGFLPETSGDLILAPRDFTKRMGSDFDVDKLYTYNYNHFYDLESGQIKTNFLSDKKTIEKNIEAQKEKINTIKESMKLSKKDQKLLDAYVEDRLKKFETETETEEDLILRVNEIIEGSMSMDLEASAKKLDHAFDILSVLKRSYKAARENNLQDIRLQILGSTNPEIVASNFSLDSYGDFESLAPMVEAIREKRGLVPEISSILSDTYQRNKYINATAGKDGVGAFSLDSTFNATVQGKNLVIPNLSEENYIALFGTFENPRIPTAAEILAANSPIAIFGDTVSKGDLSSKYTLRSQAIIQAAKEENRALTTEEKKSLKLKSTIIKNLQSTSVDNEKFQILDKLNINNNTFDAIRAMTMLGFEEQDIAGLLTQEIMWEYLTKLRNSQSSLVAYNPDSEGDIFQELVDKYDPEGRFKGLTPEDQKSWAGDSGEQLIRNLESQTLKPLGKDDKTLDFNLKQIAILQKFRELTETGKDIKKLQSTINTSSKGLPKSLLELQAKVRQINNLPFSPIFNASNLLGNYEKAFSGYVLTEPTTINGFASYYGAMFGDPLFSPYFPYNRTGFMDVVNEVMTHMPNALDKSLAKQTEMTRDIFNDVRSFLYANTDSQLFGDDPTTEQRRLFIDVTKGPKPNMSLAKILQNLSKENWFQKNGFLNKLSFDINKNGTISRINFEAATAENLDERNIYDGFLYLLDKNFPIGTFNDVEYTSRTLAQDLVAAAFLEGGNQGAKQYLKYVPASYLKTLGFGNYLGNIPFNFEQTFHGVLTDEGEMFYANPSRFTRQYFQNNPDKTKTISLADIKGNEKKAPDEFSLTPEAIAKNIVDVIDPNTGEPTKEQTKFVSIYDAKLPSKYALYEFDSSSRTYKRLPVLAGSYGFVQYNSNRNISNPIESPNQIQTPKGPEIESPGYSMPGIPVQPVRGFNPDVVNNTKKIENAADLVLAKNLSNTGMALDDLLNTLGDADGVSSLNQILLNQLRDLKLPAGFKVEYIKASMQKLGGYNYDTKTLQINLNTLPTMSVDDFATMIAHELIHTHTGNAIYDYQDGKLDNLTDEQIKAIQKLESLQQAYIEYLKQSGSEEELNKFIESYKAWKKGTGAAVEGDVSKLYGAMKLSEFVTMALTDQAFQNHLKNIIDEEGLSVWDRIKQMLSELLGAMGIDIPAGSALASTIKSTMDLISETQKTIPTKTTTESFKYYGAYYNIKVVDGVAVDVTNLKKGASETNIKFDERKNKILSAFKENPSVDPQSSIAATQTTAPLGQKQIKRNRVQVKTIFTDFDLDEQSLFNEPTVEKYETAISNLEFDLSTDGLSDELRRSIEIKLQDIKNSFEIVEPTQLTATIVPSVPLVENEIQDARYELFPGVYANAGQREAIDALNNFLTSDRPAFLLQGKGGTGKTTIIKKVLAGLNPKKVLAIGPTHKAKEVLDASINPAFSSAEKIKVTTLQAALAIKLDETTGKFTPDTFKRNKDDVPIKKFDYIVIDESSMISDKLLREIKEFASPNAKIIFMGDRAQLPPVGQEKDSDVFAIQNGYELKQKMRQAATSPIINIGSIVAENVERPIGRVSNPITPEMRVNSYDEASGSSLLWEKSEAQAIDQFVLDFQAAPGDMNAAKIITFNNQVNDNSQSVKNLNRKVRAKLFGPRANTEKFIPGEVVTAYAAFTLEKGQNAKPLFNNSEDLLVQSSVRGTSQPFVVIANSQDKGERKIIVNFDIDYVTLINKKGAVIENIPVIAESSKAEYNRILDQLSKQDRQLAYVLIEKFANIEYGYAITSHKAQGSTYKNVYVMEDNIMGSTNAGTVKAKNQSLYVAVSRPTTKLVMVSTKNSGTKEAPVAKKFDPSKLSDPSLYSTPPSEDDYNSEMDDYYNDQEDKDNYMDDYMNQGDEMLQTSPINRSDYENYLLICGK